VYKTQKEFVRIAHKMLLINFFFYFISIFFFFSSAKKGRIMAKNQYEKKAIATQQLVIVQPNANTTLIANTTSTILIESQNLNKSMRDAAIETVTTFNCNGEIISVTSSLGVPTNYTVNSSLSGNCIVFAEVPNNPEFQPSAPLVVEILTPLYFEGTSETAFHTSESLPIFVRSANDAKLNILFVITCGSAVKSIPIITSTTTIKYPLPSDLVGDCIFTTTNVPVGYIPIYPIPVTISPSIFFVTPTQNIQYPPGSTISATLIATDGNSNLSVTVELT
jgi:hypothetical protein